MTRKSNVASLIDALGEVRRSMADLVEKEEQLKRALAELGEGIHNGVTYCATVSSIVRTVLDPKKVARRLTPRAYKACLKRTSYTEVRCTARSAATGRRTVMAAPKAVLKGRPVVWNWGP